jgi:lipopolysaccharide biosynthesis regulator YciM
MIEFEYWWLLVLPLFFMLGWLAARVDMKQLLSESSALPASYFKGLNFLIKEQHDKAIEAFVEAVKSNTESLELHFALGSLFRRRGEVDRAIHLHQNLLERPQLSELQKTAIMVELAQDFLKAGLFDRAESLFHALCDAPSYQQPALRALLDIYIREREWQQAIDTAQTLQHISGIPFHKEIAEFHCELAAAHPDHAPEHLADALHVNPYCVRASIMQGDRARAQEDHDHAIEAWRHIEFQKPQYLGLVAARLLKSYQALGRGEEGLALIKSWARKFNLTTVLNVVYEATLNSQGATAAAELAREELVKKPSLNILDALLNALESSQVDAKQDLPLMKKTVHHFLGNSRSFCCDQCGFKARQYYWQCPGCNGWETFPPEPNEQPLR